jgi:glycosyltransferase involved in cell wall biosynthesis
LTFYPPDGGVTRHVIDLVGHLDPDLWLVEVACPPESEPWRELADRPGLTFHPLTPGKEPGLSDLADLRRLLRLVARADVVHAHASKAGFLTRLAAAIAGQRAATVFTPHSWSFWAHDWRSSLWLALERRAANWCRAIVAVSDDERRAGIAERVGSTSQYHVIRNGIDPAPFAGERRAVRGRILLVGRLARQKRPDVAVRALGRILERHPEAQLDLAAHGPLEDETRALVAELGLQQSVRFLGKRRDVPELLAEAECFLLTSDYEGCPYTVLEAMAAGVPVVSTRVGGVPELVADGETGLLVEPGDPAAAAAAIQGVLDAPERARLLGEAGRARALSDFGIDRMVRETCSLYDSLG